MAERIILYENRGDMILVQSDKCAVIDTELVIKVSLAGRWVIHEGLVWSADLLTPLANYILGINPKVRVSHRNGNLLDCRVRNLNSSEWGTTAGLIGEVFESNEQMYDKYGVANSIPNKNEVLRNEKYRMEVENAVQREKNIQRAVYAYEAYQKLRLPFPGDPPLPGDPPPALGQILKPPVFNAPEYEQALRDRAEASKISLQKIAAITDEYLRAANGPGFVVRTDKLREALGQPAPAKPAKPATAKEDPIYVSKGRRDIEV